MWERVLWGAVSSGVGPVGGGSCEGRVRFEESRKQGEKRERSEASL